MSQISVEIIIGKILLDADFRSALLAYPDQTLSEFNLTMDEKAELKCLDYETLESLAHTLEVRMAQIRKTYQEESFNH